MIYKHNPETNTWTPASLRADFPDTSFPRDLSTAVLPDGYAYCHPSPAPACGEFERIEQSDPIMVDGKLTQQWAVTPWAIADIAAFKLSRIREERKRVEHGGIMHDGVRYESDPTARAKYVETMLTFQAFPALEIPGWKASDGPDGMGIYVTMTPALLQALWTAGKALDAAAFAWEAARQAEIAAALATGDVAAMMQIQTTYEV